LDVPIEDTGMWPLAAHSYPHVRVVNLRTRRDVIVFYVHETFFSSMFVN